MDVVQAGSLWGVVGFGSLLPDGSSEAASGVGSGSGEGPSASGAESENSLSEYGKELEKELNAGEQSEQVSSEEGVSHYSLTALLLSAQLWLIDLWSRSFDVQKSLMVVQLWLEDSLPGKLLTSCLLAAPVLPSLLQSPWLASVLPKRLRGVCDLSPEAFAALRAGAFLCMGTGMTSSVVHVGLLPLGLSVASFFVTFAYAVSSLVYLIQAWKPGTAAVETFGAHRVTLLQQVNTLVLVRAVLESVNFFHIIEIASPGALLLAAAAAAAKGGGAGSAAPGGATSALAAVAAGEVGARAAALILGLRPVFLACSALWICEGSNATRHVYSHLALLVLHLFASFWLTLL